jgi:curved DNA-binding protein CbpA
MARPLDPYRTLELPRDATLDEVKTAYRRLAKQYHPDSAGERAVPRFLAVQAAYEALTEGPGKLRSVIGGRSRPAPSSSTRPSTGRTRGTGADPWAARSGGSGPRATRGAGATPGSPGPRSGARASQGAAGPTGAGAASGSASGDGASGGRGGSSRTRGPAGPRPRRTRRAPGSTSYDGAEAEPFEPEWQGASWYGGSSGTYWTLNPREFADPRKHGPEYLARGADNGRGQARSRRGRAGDAKPGDRPTVDWTAATGTDPRRPADGSTPFGDRPDAADVVYGGAAAHRPGSSSARRVRGPEVSPFGLIYSALLAVALVAALFAVMAETSTPGAVSVVPVVAFCGIAIVALVRVLRRDGRPRA